MSLAIALFFSGMLTILLPCILPLIPIVLGVSIAGRSKLRPLLTIVGMVVSFVGFTFLLHVVLTQFIEVANYLRTGTYFVLLLFGAGFLTHNKIVQYSIAVLGGLFFLDGWPPETSSVIASLIAAVFGAIAMMIGGKVATSIQQLGSNAQMSVRSELGEDNPWTALLMGLTMGLVWVPCAGPALGFAFTLVREQPGLAAFFYLLVYGIGAAIPLMLIGYGGQKAVHSVRFLSQYSGRIKQVSGVILIMTALLFRFELFRALEIWLVSNTSFGSIGTQIESDLFKETVEEGREEMNNEDMDEQSSLPVLGTAPELVGLGEWFNSEPLTMEQLRGKVVLVNFWTYSCINCINTFPRLRQTWAQYQDENFVILGVHTPEFTFEKSAENLAGEIKKYDLQYPIVQDNDYATWRAYENRYWPAKYVVDAQGRIRYSHFGEGKYDEMDAVIEELLQEIS